MKIKFKNGYTVEVTDCDGMSRGQIYKEAYDAMIATKRMNDSKNNADQKAEEIKLRMEEIEKEMAAIDQRTYFGEVGSTTEDGYRYRKLNSEYEKLARELEALNLKSTKDSHPEITYKSNLLSHIKKIESAISKRTGEVINEDLLDYEIRNLEADMEADLNHETWYKKYHPEALKTIVNDYQKFINAIKFAKDEKYIVKVAELEEKLDNIKKVFRLSETVEDTEDIRIEDVPIAEPTASYSLNFDPYVSQDNIDKANSYLTSRDPEQKKGAIVILKNEFPALRKNLEDDIAQAEDLIEKFNKDQLRTFLETYDNIINVYSAANMMAEAKTLRDLYNELFYNALHLGRMGTSPRIGTKSVVARRRF